MMPRRNQNARRRETPRKIKIKVQEPKIRVYEYPRQRRGDIYPGRVVAVGWLEEKIC